MVLDLEEERLVEGAIKVKVKETSMQSKWDLKEAKHPFISASLSMASKISKYNCRGNLECTPKIIAPVRIGDF